jgi:hypothetical protein
MRVASLASAAFAVAFTAIAACGGSSAAPGSTSSQDAGNPTKGNDSGATTEDAASPGVDSAAPPDDAGADAVVETLPEAGFPPDPTDGTPTRQACTGNFGTALSNNHGRLDGILVAVVQPYSNKTCNSDSHVHLQVSVNGATYDVATNLQTNFHEADMALPGGAWSEGWHANMNLDYPTIGLHSPEFFTPASESALAAYVTTDLENANHVAIFATGYGPTGVHDIHRRGNDEDGAIFIDPLSPTAHGLFFSFSTDPTF